MSVPKWAAGLLGRLAARGRAEDVLGDLEETHRRRVQRRGRWIAGVLTRLEALDIALALLRDRARGPGLPSPMSHTPELVAGRAGGGRRWPRISWLDFKLGFRMLVKYPGLTVVGGFAIAFGVSVAAATFEFVDQVLRPTLPLDGGDRIIGIRIRDRQTADFEPRAVYDFRGWRDELSSVADVGAFRTLGRNLIVGEGGSEPIEVAEISASAFRVARVPPLMGRALDASDEQLGAPPVVVLGYDVWQTRFVGDPAIVGQAVRLGSTEATVVGVMPEGFAFPVSQRLWTPLRLPASGYAPREGPAIYVFGRLAPGVTLEQAQAELTAFSLRAAADLPDTHRHLTAEIRPFARSMVTVSPSASLALLTINVLAVLLLVLACGNVALLMFARAASRESEIVVRSALGAGRGRIIMQLLAEALVLAGVGAIVGIAAVRLALESWLMALNMMIGVTAGGFPFWFRDTLAPTTVLYAAGLTVLGAVIAGVVPGLKATRGLQTRLKRATQGDSGVKLGGVWTAVIVTQIAVTVTVPVLAFFVRWDLVGRSESTDVGFPEHEYLAARLEMDSEGDGDPATFFTRFNTAIRELESLLAIDSAVAGVTRADRLPRTYHPHRLIEVDEGGAVLLNAEAWTPAEWPSASGPKPNCTGECARYRVSSAVVDRSFFEVLDAPIRAGRGFEPGDYRGDAGVVIVNQSFVERVMGGRNPVGRRLRYTYFEELGERGRDMEPSRWLEIVGVVRDMGMAREPDPKVAGIYHPMPPRGIYPARIAVHIRGADAQSFARRLRTIGATADPALLLEDVERLDKVGSAEHRLGLFWFRLIVSFSAIAMLISMAGIYSVMAFTVSRRTREIGIRVALGSRRASVILAIFRRPLIHVAIGVALGAILTALLSVAILRSTLWPTWALMVPMYALLMMGVCLLACLVPARRALAVQPAHALRAE